jgi:hypothetical protein
MANVDQMQAIASHKALNMMRRAAARASQAGQTATQIMSYPQCKQTKIDRLRWQDASAH